MKKTTPSIDLDLPIRNPDNLPPQRTELSRPQLVLCQPRFGKVVIAINFKCDSECGKSEVDDSISLATKFQVLKAVWDPQFRHYPFKHDLVARWVIV